MTNIDPAIVEATAAIRRALWCSQCGHALAHRACGPTHAILSAQPERHRHLAPLIAAAMDAARAEGDKQGAARVREAVEAVYDGHEFDEDKCSCGWPGYDAKVRGEDHAEHVEVLVRAALTEAAPHD